MAATSKKTQKEKPKQAAKINKGSKKPFKSDRKPKSETRSEAVSLQLEEEIPDFPRGGGSSLSRQERDEIRAEVDAEYELDERQSKKNTRKKPQMKRHAEADDLGSLFGGGITGKLPRYANKITIKNISPGMKLWGVVTEVNEKDLVVSLPGGLRGLVHASEALDIVSDHGTEDNKSGFLEAIFNPGQLVSCVVLHLDDDKKESGKRKIWLSLRLSLLQKGYTLDAVQEGMVLTSYVKSIEDHGYILQFGIPSVSGFLAKSTEDENKEFHLRIGTLIQGIVKSVDRTRKVVYLSRQHDAALKSVTKDLKGISMDLLIPGMMVNARVQSVLENGIMLSFLTYFTATVDVFHLLDSFSGKNWKDDYSQNKKVNARILFIDPSTRAIGLTLNPHLVRNKAPPLPVTTGGIFDQAKVVRIDRESGLLLQLPSSPLSTPAYVHISEAAEDGTRKLEKKFQEGSFVRARILGINNLDGLAIGTLKASAIEGAVFIHSDVKPGMVVKGKVVSVDSFGAIVQFSGGLKALCPLRHMSEFEIVKPGKKFKVGGELVFRVLGCKSKRITVTHKKTLVKSKLPVLSSYADATDGLVTHGWITKIENHGCFVRFYNGVQGFAPRHELGLEPGRDPESVYHAGEVVKCRVTSAVHASRRVNLSFVIKPTRVSEEDTIKVGSLVSGVVESLTHKAVVVTVKGKSYVQGTIPTEHLADHHEHAYLMKSLLKPGHEFDQLLVLDVEGNNVLLSSKQSLVSMARDLPSDICQIRPNSVLHGYICNLIETGCFVRYLGRLTGFSPKSKAMDETNADLSEVFYLGQSVRSNVIDVNNDAGRITLSLKQSLCSSTDASFIQEYFLMDEKIGALRPFGATGTGSNCVVQFSIGEVVEGIVKESNDVGLVVCFESNTTIRGFIPQNQLGGSVVELGSVVHAVVLDFSRADGIIELSLKPEFIRGSAKETSSKEKKKRKRVSMDLEMHEKVNAVVEIVKEKYLVLSVPEYDHAIGYASLYDYNTQKLPVKHFSDGQSVIASVAALPNPSSSGRLLLLLDSVTEAGDSSRSKRAKKKSSFKIGSVVQAEITEIKPLELRVNFGIGFRGRIYITEVNDDNTSEDPFGSYKIGQTVTARIVSKPSKSVIWELSIKPEILGGSADSPDRQLSEQVEFATGQLVNGYVYKVDSEWVWLAISRNVKAQLFILDSASEPNELKEFQKRFHVGKAISGYVLTFNKEKKMLRLVQRPILNVSKRKIDGLGSKTDASGRNVFAEDVTVYTHEGDILGGRISKILPGVGGLRVQIGPHVHGRVHFTELTDLWISDPLSGYCEGQFVKCKVLEISRSVNETIQVDLSLRSLLDGMVSHNQSELHNNVDSCSKRFERIEDLSSDMVVKGYVKNTMSKGCFVMLSRKLEAKILLSNLSDGFVDDPEKEFPVGKLVTGRVLSVEPLSKRVEVTLKSADGGPAKSQADDYKSLHVGETISGRIKRIEPYGLFITIGSTNMVGLCHVSELSDDKIDSIDGKYKAGERVTVKILKVEEERRRISLGMKQSYFSDEDESQRNLIQKSFESAAGPNPSDITSSVTVTESNENTLHEMATDYVNGASMVLAHAESRASVPPLEIDLDDIENSDIDNIHAENQLSQGGSDTANEKSKKRGNKKAKEERERDIRAAEERLLEKDAPRTADEFERLVIGSPNNSFVWIKYMAYMLSLADVEKARSIAERALRTINMREENEKLNIWVAYFNLENEHGNPPEESVSKVFKRALQVCDPKKVYLALLGMYERTEQHKLADELLDKMIKKFKHSRKVWLRRVQLLLQQKEDVQPIINRALLSLRRDKHIKFLSQAAILEFKCGVPDRGRSVFEGILREYPKRTDLWSIYLDQEIRLGEIDVTRSLFERAITLSLPPKKMKFLFKKYLEYEKSVGDEERVESVKQKAMEYVESTMA